MEIFKLSQQFMGLSLTTPKEKAKDSEKDCDYPYTYAATVLKIDRRGDSHPTKIHFKEKPSRCFSVDGVDLPLDIVEDVRVIISYKRILVNTYSHFWIGSIQKEINDKEQEKNPEGLRLRKSPKIEIPKNTDNLYIKCTNLDCKTEISLTDFVQCSGKILDNFTCDKCSSKHGFIGDRCIRETICCKKCKTLLEL